MVILDAVNSILTADKLVWVAAGLSFVLLLFVRPVTTILAGGRRGAVARTMRSMIVLGVFVVVALPFVILATGEPVSGLPYGCFMLIFPLFCYYFGKGLGFQRGRRGVMDLVGIDEYDGVEDAQDRLYESRLRLPAGEAVAASIARLSRGDGDAPADNAVRPDADNKNARPSRNSEILEVAVEEV